MRHDRRFLSQDDFVLAREMTVILEPVSHDRSRTASNFCRAHGRPVLVRVPSHITGDNLYTSRVVA